MPIRHSLIRPPPNRDTAQTLVADQRKVRAIDNRTHLSSPLFSSPVDPSPAVPWHLAQKVPKTSCPRAASPSIADAKGGIPSREKIRPAPLLHHSKRQHIDLRVAQHTTGALRERRHQLAGNSLPSNLPKSFFSCYRKVNRIRPRNRRAVLSVFPMTGRAVRFIERRKIEYLVRPHHLRPRSRSSGHATAARQRKTRRRISALNVPIVTGLLSWRFVLFVSHAWIPARTANGRARNCGVLTFT